MNENIFSDMSSENSLSHIGVKRRSGRYPWGSGDSPYQHEDDFLSRYNAYKKQGLSEVEIAKKMECVDGTTELRRYLRIANHERKAKLVAAAKAMSADGKTLQEISDSLGLSGPSAASSLIKETHNTRQKAVDNLVDVLRDQVKSKGAIDIGEGVELDLQVSRDTLLEAATRLGIEEGYNIIGVGVQQPLVKKAQTNVMVLTKDLTQRDLYSDPTQIKSISDLTSDDGGITYRPLKYPQSISGDRVAINYAETGGADKDGVIEIRPGVADLSLGNSHYAQVRILVDGTHYAKGMAMYSDDIPDGYDVMFNTNKDSSKSLHDVLKPIKDDPENPFGAAIKAAGQSEYIGSDGKPHLSAINKLKEEGDWNEERVQLSSQFLAKQPLKLAKQQLDVSYNTYVDQLNNISKIKNNVVKQKMLEDFADNCDKASYELFGAGLPRQRTQVILPLTDIKDTEVYAPNFKNGETVALVRYPHAGTFEIPVLKVNNKNAQGKERLGQAADAIGINTKTAQKLSGADFDGDTVAVIPFGNNKIMSSTLKALEGFDPKSEYPYREGMRVMTKEQKGREMGIVSNLITDMTLRGAKPEEIVRAVKHSMVVIDAEKHKLDYKQSEIVNDIASLKKKYQTTVLPDGTVKTGGASTLISAAKSPTRIPERRAGYKIDPDTGEKIFSESGRTYFRYKTNANGEKIKEGPFLAEEEVPRLSLYSDAHALSSGTKMEDLYANHSNRFKALANTARKMYISTPNEPKYDKDAAKLYSKEVSQINEMLKNAGLNKPKERQALIRTNARVKELLAAHPELKDKENKTKYNKRVFQIQQEERAAVGASSKKPKITDAQWKAVQSGAVSFSKAKALLNLMDQDDLKERALPKPARDLTPAQKSRLTNLHNIGYNQAEIAAAMGVSVSAVNAYLKDKRVHKEAV